MKEGYFKTPGANPGRTFDIALAGQRFRMIKEGDSSWQTAAPQIIVVQHWGT